LILGTFPALAYHLHMRRLVFILMIALLPLRGWMAEAMATEMATMHLIATQSIDTPAIAKFGIKNDIPSSLTTPAVTTAPSAAMPADCDMHAKSAPDTPPSKQVCSHCQACHTLGLTCTAQIISTHTPHYAAPSAHVSLFASAQLALSQKPPIL
jgi:hypothetical protein